ncbi:MAG: hypothetical protein K6A30_00450 [Lachnospiraceae bacterium]|nr:hypothetical protein [Lachnospiraceae bacterium]
MSEEFILNSKGEEKFEVFELVKVMNHGALLIDGTFDKRFPLVCGCGMRIKGKFNLQKLEKAIQKAYDSIDTMRAFINMDDPDDLYFKIRKNYEYHMELLKAEGETADERYENAKNQVQGIAFQRDTYRKSACNFFIYKLDENDIFFSMLTEHGLIDGQAVLIIVKKIIIDYIGLPMGKGIHKKGLADFYEFYEKFKDEGTMQANTEFWNEKAKGLEDLYKYNPPLENNAISESEKLLKVPMKTLKAACKNYRTTMGNLVIAAYEMAIAKTYGISKAAISCVSANHTIPDYFDSAVLQLDSMLLVNEVPVDETPVQEVLKASLKTTSEGLMHTPSFYSKTPFSRFLFSYAGDLLKGMDPSKMPGLDITSWMPESIPEHVFDVDYIFLIAFEQRHELELHFATCDKVYNRNDFISITQGMVDIFTKLGNEKNLTMEQLLK